MGQAATRASARVLLLCALLILAACREHPESSVSEQLLVFGTLVDVQVIGPDPHRSRAAIDRVESEFQRMHRDLHAWEAGLLVQVNQAFASGRTIDAGPEIAGLIERSRQAEVASRGRYNAAIGRLIGLWGFHTSEYPIIGPPPAPASIEALLALNPSARDIRIAGTSLDSRNAAVQLDFGGIAKGHALDTALRILGEAGVAKAMVNAGGDLRVLGTNTARPWRVAIRDPDGGVVGVIELADGEAVMTSGVYERFREDARERYPHIIDPRNGQPVQELSSVTVVYTDGTWADASATALTVAGPRNWQEVATAMGVEQVLVVDATGAVQVTAALHQRMEYEKGIGSRLSVAELYE